MESAYEPNEEITSPDEFLTPEQRTAAIADILATGALRVMKERYEQDIA